jgi:hypothetical protein
MHRGVWYRELIWFAIVARMKKLMCRVGLFLITAVASSVEGMSLMVSSLWSPVMRKRVSSAGFAVHELL